MDTPYTRDAARRLDWSHIGLLLFLGTGVALYCWDAVRTSTRIENLILIVPVTGVTLAMMAFLLAKAILRPPPADQDEDGEAVEAVESPGWHTAAYFALFAAYILILNVAGFDLATFLFLVSALLLKGERRPTILLGFSAAFAILCTWAFKHMIAYPLPTLLAYP